MTMEEVLRLLDSLVVLAERECGMDTKEETYTVPDKESPDYIKFVMFLEWLAIIAKLYWNLKNHVLWAWSEFIWLRLEMLIDIFYTRSCFATSS